MSHTLLLPKIFSHQRSLAQVSQADSTKPVSRKVSQPKLRANWVMDENSRLYCQWHSK